ncbi:26434_t:CDS:1, partial [Racocetra persica]
MTYDPPITKYRKNIKKVVYDQPITKDKQNIIEKIKYDQVLQKVIIKFIDDNFLMDKNLVFKKSQAT